MTTLALKAPRPEPWRFLILAISVLMFALAVGLATRPVLHANPSQVPLKPCLSCPSCACPKALGSVKCLCPQ